MLRAMDDSSSSSMYASSLKVDLHLQQQQYDEEMDERQSTSEDVGHDMVSGSTSSSPSSKDKWSKRHVCDVADCGKSFDSKWALIRCVRSSELNNEVYNRRC